MTGSTVSQSEIFKIVQGDCSYAVGDHPSPIGQDQCKEILSMIIRSYKDGPAGKMLWYQVVVHDPEIPGSERVAQEINAAFVSRVVYGD